MKDQESNPRRRTPRPAALPVQVEQWENILLVTFPAIGIRLVLPGWACNQSYSTCH